MRDYVLEGLARAARRLEESRLVKDEAENFIAVSEALLWAMLVDDRFSGTGPYSQSRKKDVRGQPIPGLRHAWNLLKHSDLDGLVDETTGAAFPIQWPLAWFEWKWKPFEELPLLTDASPSQVECYRTLIAGRPVRLTLGQAIAFIRDEAARMGYPREL